jgi:hypothetical protein
VAYNAQITVAVRTEAELQQLKTAFARISGPTTAAGSNNTNLPAPVSAIQRMAYDTGYVIGRSIRAPFDVLGAAAREVSGTMLSFGGPMTRLATTAAASAPTIAALGVVMVAVAVPLIGLDIALRAMRLSFNWADEGANAQIRLLARTRRTFPGIIGTQLEKAESRMRVKLGMATSLFGKSADAMEDNINRRMSDSSMVRGLGGDRDLFERWGITPEAVKVYEHIKGERMGITDWLALFIKKREDLEARAALAPKGSVAEAIIQKKRSSLMADSLTMFGQKFTDIMGAFSSEDLARLEEGLKKSVPLAAVDNADEKAKDFERSLNTLKFTFGQLKSGIAGDVAPTLTEMMTKLNEWMLPVSEGGQGMGEAFRGLAGAVARHGWETLSILLHDVRSEDIQTFIDAIKGLTPKDTVSQIHTAGRALLSMAQFIAGLAAFISRLTTPSSLPGQVEPIPEDQQSDAVRNDWWSRQTRWWQQHGWGGLLFSPAEGATTAGPLAPRSPATAGAVPRVLQDRPRIGGTREGVPIFRGPRAAVTGSGTSLVPEMTERMAPAGTRPGTAAPGGTTTITSPSGRTFTVAAEYAANFQGFINDYEKAGGVIGPASGGLSARPGNASYHPRGMAIDINQVGYGIRSRTGVTLSEAQEEALAAKWGLYPGSLFRSRSDRGHFEVRNRAAALAAVSGGGGAVPTVAELTGRPSTKSLQDQPLSGGGSVLADQRARFKEELAANPALRFQWAALMASEQSGPAMQTFGETAVNRANAWGTSLSSIIGNRTYYQPYQNRSIYSNAAELRRDPEKLAEIYRMQDAILAGSNRSNLATHNASQGVAVSALRTQTLGIAEHGEVYTRKDINPAIHGIGTVTKERNWYEQTRAAMAAATASRDDRDRLTADALLTSRQASEARDRLTAKPPEAVVKEGTAAGEAAARAFKEGIEDVSIPVKSLSTEDKERNRTPETESAQ